MLSMVEGDGPVVAPESGGVVDGSVPVEEGIGVPAAAPQDEAGGVGCSVLPLSAESLEDRGTSGPEFYPGDSNAPVRAHQNRCLPPMQFRVGVAVLYLGFAAALSLLCCSCIVLLLCLTSQLGEGKYCNGGIWASLAVFSGYCLQAIVDYGKVPDSQAAVRGTSRGGERDLGVNAIAQPNLTVGGQVHPCADGGATTRAAVVIVIDPPGRHAPD